MTTSFTTSQPHPGRAISFHTEGQTFTTDDVDKWELRASRRALRNLKTLLQGAPMLSLLQAQCDQGDAYFKSLLAASDGVFKECVTELHVRGVRFEQMMAVRKRWLALPHDVFEREAMLPAHPEHYAAPAWEGGYEGVVEVIGEHMARLRIVVTNDVPDWVMGFGDPAFPLKKPTICELEDGTRVFYILHEFRNTEEGCEARLRLLFPAAAPQVFFDDHAEHLAIEFRSGVMAAIAELERKK